MNYSVDRPIDTEEQDSLGRSLFSKELGKAIYGYNENDGLVIGLFGKWGTGKTSIINMAVNEIDALSVNDKIKPLIIKFSPWNYSDKDNLISLFFQSLKKKINIRGDSKLKKTVKALSDYAEAFDALSILPVVGSPLTAIFKTIVKKAGSNLSKRLSLDETKKILENALVDANTKIIVIIDDIDRLTSSQIRDIFQLVKQVADFPHLIYILAMDREIVSNALTEMHNIDGHEYLEKIIQVPFEIPELRKAKLNSIFFSKLQQVLDNFSVNVIVDETYWGTVFSNCVEPYINTIRDVNRVINTFQFKYATFYHETCFEDMIAITSLEVLEPKLYKWIASNKDEVCGSGMEKFLTNDDVNYFKRYSDEFDRLKIDPKLSIKCISTLFPVFAKCVNERQYSYEETTDIRAKMRVSDCERFESYFAFTFDNVKVSRSIINACLYEYDYEELNFIISDINGKGNIIFFLEEIKALVNKIPYDRLSLISSVFFELQGEFKGENSIFIVNATDLSENLIIDILEKLKNEQERYDVIRNAVETSNKNGLGILANMINRIELAYERSAGRSEKKENQIINLDHLKDLEMIYANRINVIAKSESILDINKFNMAFYLWERIDRDNVKKYLNGIFKYESNKLKFVCSMAVRWKGTRGSGWCFYESYYSQYITKEEVYNLIQEYGRFNLDEFTDIEQIKLATFILNYSDSNNENANEKDALQLLKQWTNKK